MNSRCFTGTPILLFSIVASCASAGPALLASYRNDATAGGGGAPITDLATHFALQLPTSPPLGSPVDPNVGVGVGVGVGVVWLNGQSGDAVFTSRTDPYFESFAQLATNGIDEWVGIYTPWRGFVQRESEVFSRNSDLIGFDLDSVRLVVQELKFELLPQLDGWEIYWDVTYEFYGTPVPEPSVPGYAAVGLLFLTRMKRWPS